MRPMSRERSDTDEPKIHATWSRGFWGFQILAFADHSYINRLKAQAGARQHRLGAAASELRRVPALATIPTEAQLGEEADELR